MNQKPKEYDWYKTVPLGKLADIKNKHGCVWCPRCRGRGLEHIPSPFLKIFTICKKITCCRCNGRTMVPPGSITTGEMEQLSGREKEIVILWKVQNPESDV